MPFDSDDLVEELRHSFSIVPDNDRSEYHIQDVTVSGRTTYVASYNTWPTFVTLSVRGPTLDVRI